MLYKYFEINPIVEVHLRKGSYLFELWGAQGGQGCTNDDKLTQYYGGRGAYVQGKVDFNKFQILYLYIGEKGYDPVACTSNVFGKGGFNGGSDSGCDTRDNDVSGGGGGATDIRLIKDDSNKSIYSRIIVAAGGSGSVYGAFGAPGGDLTDYKTAAMQSKNFIISDTDQTNGYSLGQGEKGLNSIKVPSSGAGGGFYGGKTGKITALSDGDNINYLSVSSSGSSYISGYPGCNSVDENGIHTNSPNHYSGIVFYDSKMFNGSTRFLNPNNEYEEGHIGNGAIRITTLFNEYSCQENIYLNVDCILSFSILMFLSKAK